MSLREILLVLSLLSAIALIATGVGVVFGHGWALIASGLGLGVFGFLMFVEVES